jgi:hypothetical protein
MMFCIALRRLADRRGTDGITECVAATISAGSHTRFRIVYLARTYVQYKRAAVCLAETPPKILARP